MHVVLAYSGGLDTSAAIIWLKSVKQVGSLTAVLVDVGQSEDFGVLLERAGNLGADRVILVDVKEQMCQQGIQPTLMLGATYEMRYLLGTAIARPFIADALIDTARNVGADAICHGATGKGNDYLRFEQRIGIRAPELKIISPWREWEFSGREDALALIQATGMTFPRKGFDYSVDANLWHTSYEGGELEDLEAPLPELILEAMKPAEEAEVSLEWRDGLPIVLNGTALPLCDIVCGLNKLLKHTGYGWLDLVETRTNGLKSRGIYHTPAGTLLYAARAALNPCLFAKPTLDYLGQQGRLFGEMLYRGIWEHPVQNAVIAAVKTIYQDTSGRVEFRIQGGTAQILNRKTSPQLFAKELGGFGYMDQWSSETSQALVSIHHLQHYSVPASETEVAHVAGLAN